MPKKKAFADYIETQPHFRCAYCGTRCAQSIVCPFCEVPMIPTEREKDTD